MYIFAGVNLILLYMVIKKARVCSTREYYVCHLRIMNVLLPVKMSEKEMEFVGCWMMYGGGEMDDEKRGRIRECMGLSASGCCNYIASLRRKGFIEGNRLWGKLEIDGEEQGYMIKLVRED